MSDGKARGVPRAVIVVAAVGALASIGIGLHFAERAIGVPDRPGRSAFSADGPPPLVRPEVIRVEPGYLRIHYGFLQSGFREVDPADLDALETCLDRAFTELFESGDAVEASITRVGSEERAEIDRRVRTLQQECIAETLDLPHLILPTIPDGTETSPARHD